MKKRVLKTEEVIIGNKITLRSGGVYTTFVSNSDDTIHIRFDDTFGLGSVSLSEHLTPHILDLIIVLQGIEKELEEQKERIKKEE